MGSKSRKKGYERKEKKRSRRKGGKGREREETRRVSNQARSSCEDDDASLLLSLDLEREAARISGREGAPPLARR